MPKKKKWIDKYEELSDLGEGGNAKVYQVRFIETKEIYALKELQTGGDEKHCRFIDEINISREYSSKIEGIIPIINYSEDEYWYTMPIAEPILQYITEQKLNIEEIVKGVIQLCDTLEKLHEKGISHRDIKPDNIYFYKNRFCLGDFGLVDFPEHEHDFTKSDRGIGAIFTIAPEMKRNPKTADGKKADAFSLAKTMWMFLTKDKKGFDGVYNYLDPTHSLRYIKKYKNEHTAEIDELFKCATDNNPDIRPTVKAFKEKLMEWIDIYEDTNKSQASDWRFLNRQLFGLYVPESTTWVDKQTIIEVLNVVGRTPAYNHMLFHSGGGLDFSHAEISAETDCIKIYDSTGYCNVVKPKRLYFEGFAVNFRWNYFMLELDELNSVLGHNSEMDGEYLVEDTPAHYVSAQYAQYKVSDYESGVHLPEGFQTVYRYTKGKFLIVMKNGPYNGIAETYDGRHGECTTVQFREYIDNLVNLYSKTYHDVKERDGLKDLSDNEIEHMILNSKKFTYNPFNHRTLKHMDYDKIREQHIEKQKSMHYIHQEYVNWNFSDMIENHHETNSSAVKFAFIFECPNSNFSLEDLINKTNNYLCIDGHIRELNNYSNENCYYIYDRDTAVEFRNKLEKRAANLLTKSNMAKLDEYEYCFSIELIKCGKPVHLFTKEEIKEVMRNADDRFNNQLVIDENGYARVIQNCTIGHLFPVSHETWNAGNVYVGKYSNLSTLNDVYVSSLQGWLLYLQTGRKQYMDYVYENANEEEIIMKIGKYYIYNN